MSPWVTRTERYYLEWCEEMANKYGSAWATRFRLHDPLVDPKNIKEMDSYLDLILKKKNEKEPTP